MSEQRPDQLAPAAGWYTDPSDGARLRWWSGTVWTEQSAQVPEPAAPERRWGTAWVWLLAFSPWLTTTSGYFALTVAGPSDPSPWDSILLLALPFAVIIPFAVLDMRQLRQWHGKAAHWAWAVLGGPIYIWARTVVLPPRAGRFGTVPLWVALGNMVAATLPFIPLAGLYLWGLVMYLDSLGSPS